MSSEPRVVHTSGTFLRRVQGLNPSYFRHEANRPLYVAFIPNSADSKGISVNLEGPSGETPESLLAKSLNPRLREYGGVLAVTHGLLESLGLSVTDDPDLDTSDGRVPTLGHGIIEELSRQRYDTLDGKKRIKSIAEKIVGSPDCIVRIAPKKELDASG